MGWDASARLDGVPGHPSVARTLKITPPRARSRGARHAAFLAASALVLVAFFALRLRFLGPLMDMRPGSTLALWAAAALAVTGAARILAVRPGAAAGLALPAALVLLVATVNSPLPHEMRAFAEALPHPDGASPSEAMVPRPFPAGHPTARVSFVYPEETDLVGLTHEAVRAFEAEGWVVSGVTRPRDENAGSAATFGYFGAARWGFQAACFLGNREVARMDCTVTV